MVDKIKLPDDVPPLSTYYMYLTGGCNLACRHCWIAPSYQPNGGTGGHLDYGLFALALEEGLPLGLSNVKLTGGEPLLHPDFIKMIDLLREKELSLGIETNGTLMTESLARFLKDKSTLDHISVSLDGSEPETHDSFRGVRGSFEKACQGIRHLVNVGYRPQIIMSLHAENINEIEAIIQLAEGLGAASVKFNLIQPSGRGKLMTERGQVSSLMKLIQIGQWIENDLRKRTSISLVYSWPMAFFNIHSLLTFQGYSCSIFNVLGILPSGNLAMCGIGMQIPELSYGQIGQERIATIWTTHPMLVALRKRIPYELEGICGECVLRDRCLGLCVAENYLVHNRLTAPGWFCQEAFIQGRFPENRKKTRKDDKNEPTKVHKTI
jgi:SynChlorMet cassette radical SAM/SPASM protein ScmF